LILIELAHTDDVLYCPHCDYRDDMLIRNTDDTIEYQCTQCGKRYSLRVIVNVKIQQELTEYADSLL